MVLERLLTIIEQSRKGVAAFVSGLPDEEREAAGTYEQWCAKDNVAHLAYWVNERVERLEATARGDEPPPPPGHYEQANADCFQRYCQTPWDEVRTFAESSLNRLAEAVRRLSQDQLLAPSSGDGRPLWMDIVGYAYTHPLMHLAGYHIQHGRPLRAALLWQEWGALVAPLDDGADWQGLVRYNQACGFALAGQKPQALEELREALKLRPSLTAWSKQDSDLASLHDLPEFKALYAPEHWWRAMASGPISDALADQFLRVLSMFRLAVQALPAGAADQWRLGESPCERPAGLALHLLDALDGYCALKPGEGSGAARFGVNWEDKDAAKLPDQAALLDYLDDVEVRLTAFLAEADWAAPERLFPWTGATLLGRAAYTLRHTQHHLAELCLELHRRGIKAPDWQ